MAKLEDASAALTCSAMNTKPAPVIETLFAKIRVPENNEHLDAMRKNVPQNVNLLAWGRSPG